MDLNSLKYKGKEVDQELYSAFVTLEQFIQTEAGQIVMHHLMRLSLVGYELGMVDGNGNPVTADCILNRQRWIREIEKILSSKPVETEEEENDE